MVNRVTLRVYFDARMVRLTPLALALAAVVLLAQVVWGQGGGVSASSVPAPFVSALDEELAPSSIMRSYYLTREPVANAGQTLTACAAGYHMASVWEILDPSRFQYNVSLGATREDSGWGPPAFLVGLIRTGYSADTSTTSGWANCEAWTSSASSDYGSYAQLPSNWTAAKDIHVWQVGIASCAAPARVWCLQDHILYLPLMFKG